MKPETIKSKISKLKAEKLKLTVKAFKQFPNSPIQLKTKAEIKKISNKIDLLNKKL